MMKTKALCFGSLNIDYVYEVEHIVRPGETLDTKRPGVFAGGKGLNQSVALAKAGVCTAHAGKIGPDGAFLRELLERAGVDTSSVAVGADSATGHAIIQVDPAGQNSILLFGGANREITDAEIEEALAGCGEGDILLLQNELNATEALIRAGHRRGMFVAFNCAPFSEEAKSYPYELVDCLFVNETEGAGLSGRTEPGEILDALAHICPGIVVLTLGTRGAMAAYRGQTYAAPAFPVRAVDTTGAGDTYTGYFLAAFAEDGDISRAMRLAAAASALEVTRPGAAASIPAREEAERFLRGMA
ncbi:MAG: ribokinase [Clostridiaceae bacterium]|nr:ribokinase [Clostridiaceae bacterium]